MNPAIRYIAEHMKITWFLIFEIFSIKNYFKIKPNSTLGKILNPNSIILINN